MSKPLVIFFILAVLTILGSCSSSVNLTTAPKPGQSEMYHAFIAENAPSQNALIALQRLTEPYLNNRQWDKAIELYEQYYNLFPDKTAWFDQVIEILKADKEGLIVTNIGHPVNTVSNEYGPVLTACETRLYFTAYDRDGGFGGEDVFYTDIANGTWGKVYNIGRAINTRRKNEALDCVSSDGNMLVLMGNYGNSLGSGDIYYVERTTEGWGEIQQFPRPINTEFFEGHAFLTADGNAMLFTSDRPCVFGSYQPKGSLFNGAYIGNTDIYVTLKTDDGWSDPINLGPTINTPYGEYSPFLHPDGKTLYFSSDGHPGLGRLDVFKSTRLDDKSWTSWSKPENLGKEINTSGHDWGYIVATSGNLAYFSARNKPSGKGGDDIYTIALPEKARPQPVATIRGIVTDESFTPLIADIVWEDLSSGEQVGKLQSSPSDGAYFIVLPLNKNYGYFASKSGYYPNASNINLIGVEEALTIEENIILTSIQQMIEQEVSIRLNNIFFAFDSYELLPESYPELNRLSRILKENTESRIEISGHTDNIGSETYNLNLSEKRAQSVVTYLISLGHDPAKITAKGYGFSKPVDTNETEEGRAINRRVEFRFL